jgi:hypothetical protein
MRYITTTTLIFFVFIAKAQTITGSWYGDANVALEGKHNNYLTELLLKQKDDEVVGIFGYYFRNGYESVYIRGKFDKKTRTVSIKNIPVTYFRASSIDGVDCYMHFTGTMIASKVRTSMNGYFATDAKYRYTCPELEVQYTLDTSENKKQDSLIKHAVARKIWQPLPFDKIIGELEKDTANKEDDALAAKKVLSKPDSLMVVAFEARKNVINDIVEVQSDSVRINFYDNGDIDGDSIAIFLNKLPVLTHQLLTAKALNVYIKLDSTKEINDISMFAENLGSIPPNTALMIITDGIVRKEVYLSSSLIQNATVRIKRKRP